MRYVPLARLQYLVCWILSSILTDSQTALAQVASSACNTASPPITVLGQTRDTPYVVLIPTGDRQTLARVQQLIPTAFLTTSRLGPYILVGAYAERGSAEFLSVQLRQRGLDARVAFLPL